MKPCAHTPKTNIENSEPDSGLAVVHLIGCCSASRCSSMNPVKNAFKSKCKADMQPFLTVLLYSDLHIKLYIKFFT